MSNAPLALELSLALSLLHAALDKQPPAVRKQLNQELADLAAHAARKDKGLPWPPREDKNRA